MITDSKIFARFLATIAWADGEYSEIEKETLQQIAQNLAIPDLTQEVDLIINKFLSYSGLEVTNTLNELAPLVNDNDKDELLAACIQMMGCDNYLADEEISNFFVIARMLGKSNEDAEQLLLSLTDQEEEVIN